MLRTLYRSALASAMLAVAGAALLTLPAQPAMASSHYIGTRQESARCASQYPSALCLYYHGDGSGAIWYTGVWWQDIAGGDPNLGDNRFVAGTGAGAGVIVRNNAAYMDCDWVNYACESFYSPNYTGNYDIEFNGQGGELYLTWNDEASVYHY